VKAARRDLLSLDRDTEEGRREVTNSESEKGLDGVDERTKRPLYSERRSEEGKAFNPEAWGLWMIIETKLAPKKEGGGNSREPEK